jgi:hypothetical protein
MCLLYSVPTSNQTDNRNGNVQPCVKRPSVLEG